MRFGWGSRIVACSWLGSKTQYVDVSTAKQVHIGSTLEYETTLSPDKKHFIRVKDGLELWVKESKRHRRVKTWQSSLVRINDVQFSPDGKALAVAGLSPTETPIEFYDVVAAG